MKTFLRLSSLIALVLFTTSSSPDPVDGTRPDGFITGTPDTGSMDQLAFGPDGILFIGDTKKAQILALETGDVESRDKGSELNLSGFDDQLAAALGTSADNIEIRDLAVNPISKNIYLAVATLDGNYALLRLRGEKLEPVLMENVSYAATALENPVAADAEDGRGRPLRQWSVSDLMYHDGRVLVSGLSNKEFGSTFRSIPFPFSKEQEYASLEIYHAAHGQYETHAPIKAFTVARIGEMDYLLASYTCTPLVLFPLHELKDGEHRKGRTVAELGSGNSPLDMAWIDKEGKRYFIMSNTNRPLMRIPLDAIATSTTDLTEPVEGFAETRGLDYVSVPMVHVLQLDNLDSEKVVYLQRTSDGDLVLRTRPTQWM